MPEGTRHVPGRLSNKKKPFKSSHATKGELKRLQKGHTSSFKIKPDLSKQERINRARQIQNNKRNEIALKKRLGNANNGPPRIVSIIGLSANANTDNVYSLLLESSGVSESQRAYWNEKHSCEPIPIILPNLKSRLLLWKPERNLDALLDIAKVSDVMVLVIESSEVPFDSYGEAFISVLVSQGFPTTIGVISGLSSRLLSSKQKSKLRKNISELFQNRFTLESRVIDVENSDDSFKLLRMLTQINIKEFWRNRWPYLLAQKPVKWTPSSPDSLFGTLSISGYIRGADLDPNCLVHLPTIGDFQLEGIFSDSDPYPYDKGGMNAFDEKFNFIRDSKEITGDVLALSDPEIIESLDTKVQVDADLSENQENTNTNKKISKAYRYHKVRVPKGTSIDQAYWYDFEYQNNQENSSGVDSDNENDNSDGADMDLEGEDVKGDDNDVDGNPVESDDKVDTNREESESTVDNSFSDEEEYEWINLEDVKAKDIESKAKKGSKNKKSDLDDNDNDNDDNDDDDDNDNDDDDDDDDDEIKVPDDQLAQDYLREYRALKSFRTSSWDPKENLPIDYSRIFQFKNFSRAQKNILETIKTGNLVPVGKFVEIRLINVSRLVLENRNPSLPWIVVGLYPFENKFSVMNYLITKKSHYDQSIIGGEDKLELHVGFHRFKSTLLFSEHNPRYDKSKMLKVLPDNTPTIATAFAQISYNAPPVLCWKVDPSGVPVLVASGNVFSCDPNRIVLKKVILKGKPISIEGRKVVVRGMFNHPADVKYFQKAELWTKKNSIGSITESLGTKGLFKSMFSGKINQGDSINMSLYKRVFPNWAEIPEPIRKDDQNQDHNQSQLMMDTLD